MSAQHQEQWWERPLVKHGFPTVIALILIGLLAVELRGSQKEIKASITEGQIMLRQHVTETGFYMRQICINTARDQTQRDHCQR